MNPAAIEPLPRAQQLALAYLGTELRAKLESAFLLDQRLARIVAATTEPMLGQIRLGWWREMTAKALTDRPAGDPLLTSLGKWWEVGDGALASLVDGWEELLLADVLDPSMAMSIARNRGAILRSIILMGSPDVSDQCTIAIAHRWVLADLAAHCSLQTERELLVSLGQNIEPCSERLPRNLRGLAVLDALSRYSLRNGGKPLVQGRKTALIALRTGLLGR